MNNPLVREIIVQLIGFAVFFAIIKAFAWKPLLQLLEERRKKIAKGFSDIDSGKKDLEHLQAEYQSRIAKIEEYAHLKIQEAVSEGKKIAQELREKAREEANHILVKAKENIDLEIDKAKAELRNKTVEVALAAAEKLLRKEMNEVRQREVVQDFIAEFSGEVKK